MNSCYDGFCGDYHVKLKLNSLFELTVEAEQRRTHQIYKETFENKKCAALTQSMYLTNTELYAYLKYLITHGCETKDEQCSEKLTAQLSNVNLQLKFTSNKILDTTTTIHRSFQLELVKIQLEDISRLENIINDLCRRVEDLESRVVPREQCTKLRGFKFEKPANAQAFTFTDNDRTCINSSGKGHRIIRVNRPFVKNQERYQKIDFKWNTNIGGSYVGVRKTLSTNETDTATNEDDRWFFNVNGGHLYSKEKNAVAYLPGAAREGQCISIILDTESMRLAFAIDDITLTWAFELPKTMKPDELYACVIIYHQNESVSVVD